MSIMAKRLRDARERKNLKQTQVKALTGINNKTLSGYENGVSEPDLETLNKLAELYEVSVDWLMGRTDNPKQIITYQNTKKSTDQAVADEHIQYLLDENIRKIAEAYAKLPPHKQKLLDDLAKTFMDEINNGK